MISKRFVVQNLVKRSFLKRYLQTSQRLYSNEQGRPLNDLIISH